MAKPLIKFDLKVDKKDLKHVQEMPERMAEGLFEGATENLFSHGEILRRGKLLPIVDDDHPKIDQGGQGGDLE